VSAVEIEDGWELSGRGSNGDKEPGPAIGGATALVTARGLVPFAESRAVNWGWLPALALVDACALLIIAIADVAARSAEGGAEPLFWIGLLCLYLPTTIRLLSPALDRREGLGLVLVLGLSLYLVKVMHSPLSFTFVDEFSHWRTADDIVQSGRLFRENPLLPVSALYPGQEIVAAALAKLGGTSIFHAGIAVVGAARLLLVVSLYAIYELISRSPRTAGVATVIYMANPNYLFFGAGFDYESVGLPAAMLVILASLSRQEARRPARSGLAAVALLVLGLVVITHHLTSYALSAFLLAWLASARLLRNDNSQGPGFIAFAAPVASILWLVVHGGIVLIYLAPHLFGTADELVKLGAGQSGTGRQLFQSTSGYVAPLWERLTGIASAGLVLAGLPLGLLLIWRAYRHRAIALVLALVALTYPPSLILRLTGRGWEIGNRSSEFVFFGVAFVLALAVVALVRDRHSPFFASLAALCLTVVFAGGVIAGWTPAWRMPASESPGASPAPTDPEAIAAAQWARAFLGPNNHVAAGSMPMMLMGSYGQQDVETTLSGGINANWIILSPQVGPEQIDLMHRGKVQYIVIDRRLGSSDPRGTSYYPGVPSDRALAKFDNLEAVSRIFDSGNVQLYDVGKLTTTWDSAGVP
jgi:hypothetical protein